MEANVSPDTAPEAREGKADDPALAFQLTKRG
jgi:hypothetical protein